MIVPVTGTQFGTLTNLSSLGVTSNQTPVAGAGATGAILTVLAPDLSTSTISDSGSPTGTFAQGDQGQTFTVTVNNKAAAGTSNGPITAAFSITRGLLNPVAGFPNGSGWSCTGLVCTNSNALAAGTSLGALTVTINVDANAASPQTLSVSIYGGGTAAATNLSDNVVITQLPHLAIQKTHSGQFVTGDLVSAGDTFTLTVTNSGPVTVRTAKITDSFDPSFTLGSLPAGCSNSGQTVTCTPASIAATNGTAVFVIPVAVSPAASGSISNSATVACTPSNSCLITSATAMETVSIRLAPGVQLDAFQQRQPGAHLFTANERDGYRNSEHIRCRHIGDGHSSVHGSIGTQSNRVKRPDVGGPAPDPVAPPTTAS